MKLLKIGIDFGGVVADVPGLKQSIAKEKFGIDVPLEEITQEGCMKNGFTKKTYELLTEYLYSNPDVKPMPRAVEYMRRIKDDGHGIHVISFQRYTEKMNVIGNFLSNQGAGDIEYTMTNNKPKSWFCTMMDLLIDDRIDHLEDEHNPYLCLFDAPYNRKGVLDSRIKRIGNYELSNNWEKFYEEICRISGK